MLEILVRRNQVSGICILIWKKSLKICFPLFSFDDSFAVIYAVNPKSVSGVASGKLLTSNSVGIMQPSFLKKENAWYYEDPNGKSQGPFSIAQLRKWNNSGYFPVTLRV